MSCWKKLDPVTKAAAPLRLLHAELGRGRTYLGALGRARFIDLLAPYILQSRKWRTPGPWWSGSNVRDMHYFPPKYVQYLKSGKSQDLYKDTCSVIYSAHSNLLLVYRVPGQHREMFEVLSGYKYGSAIGNNTYLLYSLSDTYFPYILHINAHDRHGSYTLRKLHWPDQIAKLACCNDDFVMVWCQHNSDIQYAYEPISGTYMQIVQ